MKNEKIVEIAIKEGFADAAIIDTADIVFDASFRPYCEENLAAGTVRIIPVRPIAALPKK